MILNKDHRHRSLMNYLNKKDLLYIMHKTTAELRKLPRCYAHTHDHILLILIISFHDQNNYSTFLHFE